MNERLVTVIKNWRPKGGKKLIERGTVLKVGEDISPEEAKQRIEQKILADGDISAKLKAEDAKGAATSNGTK